MFGLFNKDKFSCLGVNPDADWSHMDSITTPMDLHQYLKPKIYTKDEIKDVNNLPMWLTVNGEKLQNSNTDDLIFKVPYIVSYLSQFMTLLPGDVISTGTPSGVGLGLKPPRFLKPGDVVELGIDQLGTQKQKAVGYGK